ncbi:MAG TPA: 50S ribosomal protein L11 methyltransferase [Bacteroidia bacterium]|nr:50S ribosomal protein L11 methyltransferase [Bacteroidia bacterium]
MDYLELEVKIKPRQPGCDLLISELADAGFESFAETPEGFMAYIPSAQFSEEQLDSLNNIGPEIGMIGWTKKHIPGQNWNAEWEKQFQPVVIAGKCRIRAPFHTADPAYPYEIVIQPRQSFGTGHHPTTQLMLEKLLTMDLAGRSILDMGCGTGVLSILACRLGAEEAMGIDIEPNSVENARDNIQLNPGVQVKVELGSENVIAHRKFDVVLANINKNVLLKGISVYARALRTGGDLLLSGFFKTDTNELTEAAIAAGLLPHSVITKEEWALLHFKKQS